MYLESSVRGRPIRFPRESAPMNVLNSASGARLAWLLLRLRLHSSNPVVRNRKSFADGLVSLGVNADPSRVSRWESGSHRIPERVLYGYAVMLGYEPDHLTSVANNLRSALDPETEPGLLLIDNVPSTQHELDDLFNRIDSPTVGGPTWTELAASIESGTYMYLPEQMWTDIANRLTTELVRSVRIAHIRRLAASGIVIRHPAAQRVMVRSIGRLVTTPGNRFLTPAVALLRDVSNPEVDALLLRMAQGARSQSRRAASVTLARKLARGMLDPGISDTLEATVINLLENRVGQTYPTDTVNILAALEPTQQKRVLNRLSVRPELESLEESLSSGLTVSVERAHRLATVITRRATGMLPLPGGPTETDQMLVRLLEEALFHVHWDRRYQAGLLLGVSPFASVLPQAILASVDINDQYATSRCLTLNSFLDPGPETVAPLLNWVLHSPKGWLKARAMMALAPLVSEIGQAAIDEIGVLVARAEDPEVLHTGINLLGLLPERVDAATDLGPLIDETPIEPTFAVRPIGPSATGAP